MPSIVSSGKALHSAEYHKTKEGKRRARRKLILPALILLLVGLVFLLRAERFQISEVRVSGNKVIPSDTLSDVVEEVLSQKYLYIIPRSSTLLFLYEQGRLEEELLERFPRIESLDIRLYNSRVLELTLGEYVPYALYCEDIKTELIDAKCYFLNQYGFIFAEAPAFSDEVYFIYTRESVLAEPLNQEFLPREEFGILNQFIQDLELLGVETESYEEKGRERSLYLPSGGRIFWDEDDALPLVYSNLEALLNSDLSDVDETFLDRVLYIDLSIDNKAYYKFRDQP